jgi:predicted porin
MKTHRVPRNIQALCLACSSLPALCAAQGTATAPDPAAGRPEAAQAAPAAPVPVPAPAAPPSTVTLYGIIDAAVRRANNVSAAGASEVSMEDGIFTGSRLGLRVREDLGRGLTALATLESGFDPSTGNSLQGTATADFGQAQANPRFWGRDLHVGLRHAAGWGVTAGRQYTLAHQVAGRFQPQGNPNNLALSIFSSHHIARQDNVVKLDAKAAGADLSVSRTFGEAAGSAGSDAWAVSATHASGPLFVGGYVQQLNNVTDTETRKIIGLGGNYKLAPQTTVFAGAMRRTNEVSPQENQVWTLGANHEVLPGVTASAAYLHDKQSGSAALEGARKVGYVSASYAFSRRSDVYAVVDHNKVEGGYAKPAFMATQGSQTAVTLALRHRF